MRGLKLLLKIVLIVSAVPVGIIGIWLAIFAISIHFKTEGKIMTALEGGFPGSEVSINDRVDWGYANEICFGVTVRLKSHGPARREIVMVSGDLDGGTWWLGRTRYDSMRDCKKDFYRG